MSEAESLFAPLRQAVGAEAAGALERLVRGGEDHELNRISALDFAAPSGLGEEAAIAASLHAARLGLFEMSWNVLCPGCGGVLGASATLKSVDRAEYNCALCAAGYEPTLDEMVDLHGQPAGAPDRGARPERAAHGRICPPGLLELGRRPARELRRADRGDHARRGRAAAWREGDPVAAGAGRVPDRLRSRHARDAIPRREGRADARAAEPRLYDRQGAHAKRDRRAAARPSA